MLTEKLLFLGHYFFQLIPLILIFFCKVNAFLFYLYIFPFDSPESDGGDNSLGKHLPQPASGDAKILLSAWNFLFCFFSFIDI